MYQRSSSLDTVIQSVSVLKTVSPCRVLFWQLWGCNSVALPPFFPTLFRTWTLGTTLTTLTTLTNLKKNSTSDSSKGSKWRTWTCHNSLGGIYLAHIVFCCTLTGRQSGHQLWMPRSLATSFVKSWQKALAKLAVPLGACTEICLGIFTVFAKGETELAKWHWKKS